MEYIINSAGKLIPKDAYIKALEKKKGVKTTKKSNKREEPSSEGK